jgi:hypothetical protein
MKIGVKWADMSLSVDAQTHQCHEHKYGERQTARLHSATTIDTGIVNSDMRS